MASNEGGLTNDGSMLSLRKLFESLQTSEGQKDRLIEELFARYEYSSQRLSEELEQRDKLENAHAKFCPAKQENIVLSQNVVLLQEMMNREPFVFVLVDGDNTLFAESFLKDGEAGGRRAADALYRTVSENIKANPTEYPVETKVHIKAYADVLRLGKVLFDAGVVQSTNTTSTFARGFNNSRSLSDFVDAPYAGNSPRNKIADNFRLLLHDFHCRQIFLSPSGAENNIAMLGPLVEDDLAKSRITLITTFPSDCERTTMSFKSVDLGAPFNEAGVSVNDIVGSYRDRNVVSPKKNGAAWKSTGVPTPVSTPGPEIQMRRDAGTSTKSLSSAMSSSITSPTLENVDPSSWAGLVQKKATTPVIDLSRVNEKDAPYPPIRRNKKGQRIDPSLPPFDRQVVERLKKLRPCNMHYLRGFCTKAKCPHKHDSILGKAEMQSLKLIARQSVCLDGSACDDPSCIYGHCCPFPAANEGSMRGRGCINGDSCRFPVHMHAMDNVPVKFKKVT